MGRESTSTAEPVLRAGRSSLRNSESVGAAELDAATPLGPVLVEGAYSDQPTQIRAGRLETAGHAFGSVICAGDRTAGDDVARRQVARLVSPVGMVELVPASRLTRCGQRALQERCAGYDLLALGASAEAIAAAQRAPIPTLIARRCPLGVHVTDTIIVSVDDSPESSHAVALAGRLANAHGGSITIMAAPLLDPALARAVAASFRVLLHATGEIPRVFGEPLSPGQAIGSAAVTLGASLVVLGTGSGENARRNTAEVVSAVGCSVLAVPVPEALRSRSTRSHTAS